MTPVQKYMRLNLKTNDSHINQSQNWRMTNVKYFGGFAIQTDKEMEHKRPDIVVIEKREWKIINIAVPEDQNIKVEELVAKVVEC